MTPGEWALWVMAGSSVVIALAFIAFFATILSDDEHDH